MVTSFDLILWKIVLLISL